LNYVFASPAMAVALVSCNTVGRYLARRASDHLAVTTEFRQPAIG